MLGKVSKDEIKRGMLFFSERENRRMEKLAKARQRLKAAVQA
jgi:hypothetical protein